MVRLALVTSVTCTPPSAPPVRFQISQLSMVPKSTSPRSARSRRPGVRSSSQRMRGAEKYVASGRPHSCRTRSAPGSAGELFEHGVGAGVLPDDRAARPGCRCAGPTARWSRAGWRCPSADDLVRGRRRRRRAPAATIRARLRQISTASCSTQPGRGKCCWCSRWTTETSRPRASNRMHRVEVVPWSMDITYRWTMCAPPPRSCRAGRRRTAAASARVPRRARARRGAAGGESGGTRTSLTIGTRPGRGTPRGPRRGRGPAAAGSGCRPARRCAPPRRTRRSRRPRCRRGRGSAPRCPPRGDHLAVLHRPARFAHLRARALDRRLGDQRAPGVRLRRWPATIVS